MSPRILALKVLCGLVVLSVFPAPAAAAGDDGFKPIFDGKTLAGWDGDPDLWRVEDEAITGQTTADKPIKLNTFLIWRGGLVDDFELRLEFRIFGGNSGVQYRSFEMPQVGKWVVGGYQADVDAANEWTGAHYAERDRGIIAPRGDKVVIGADHKPKVTGQVGDRAKLGERIKKEDWNLYRIVACGNRLIHEINGQVMSDTTDEDREMRRFSGIIALQLHAGPPMKVQFRKVLLKRLPLEGRRKVVFVAGPSSHGYGEHEHNAGCALLAKLLNENMPGILATVYHNGWPKEPTAFDNANAVVIYADGGGGQPIIPHLKEVQALIDKGVNLACLHYAVEVPKGEAGDRFLKWIGGYFEGFWSVNPFWTAEYKEFPRHPVARGVRPFAIDDEWYYHMRFPEDMKEVTPILTALPPDATRERPDGFHSGNQHVRARKGMPEHTAWVFERPGGGRGFGFTGGHIHWNWANDDYRKIVLNAVAWVAGLEVPADGVPSKTPTFEQLEAGLDKPQPKDFDKNSVSKLLDRWRSR
ncbi:MAG: DUF1080 domain-containing protein [Phycisphaerae bacterium]|nr:DUF1080 domain-containing protein [Phycisphaerae bacterium]